MPLYLLMNVDGTVEPILTLKKPDGTYSPLEVEISKRSSERQAHIASWKEITESDLPKGFYVFREAWRHDGDKVRVDMSIAREMQRDILRALRAPKLAELDIEMIRGWQEPEVMKAIEVKKQALRDVTAFPAINAAKIPEELVKAVPDILK